MALLLASLTAAPASELTLLPLRSTSVLAERFPCPSATASAPPRLGSGQREATSRSFCVGRARMVVTQWRESLVSRLEVYDQVTGAKVLEQRLVGLGFFALDGDRLDFWSAYELWFLDPSRPSTKPRKLAPCDCGTEASPFTPAVLGGAAMCYATHDSAEPASSSGALLLSAPVVGDAEPVVCEVPRGAWTDEPSRITIRLSKPTAVCRKVLRLR